MACQSPSCWSDGNPELRAGSRQNACIGWTTAPSPGPIDWCHLGEQDKKPLDTQRPPIMFWDVTASSDQLTRVNGLPVVGDASWEKLRGKRVHGGNGSFFFVP